jgi:hypothetical protein
MGACLEESESQSCATYRPNGHGNTSTSDWRYQNPVIRTARAGTKIFAAGDRVRFQLVPLDSDAALDIFVPMTPRIRGLFP